MNDKEQDFLALYNRLDDLCQIRYEDFDRNHSMVMRYANELTKSLYNKTSERGKKINLIREIRNMLIHSLDMNKDGFLDINESLLSTLRYEIKVLENPKTAMSICTPIGSILRAKLEDNIIDTFASMTEKGYMHLPVIDDKGKLFGILSPNSLLLFLSKNKNSGSLESLKIDALKEFLPKEKHICEYYEFVKRSDEIDIIVSLFDTYHNKGKKLVMLFVTESGKSHESILGIITPYDIVSLNND